MNDFAGGVRRTFRSCFAPLLGAALTVACSAGEDAPGVSSSSGGAATFGTVGSTGTTSAQGGTSSGMAGSTTTQAGTSTSVGGGAGAGGTLGGAAGATTTGGTTAGGGGSGAAGAAGTTGAGGSGGGGAGAGGTGGSSQDGGHLLGSKYVIGADISFEESRPEATRENLLTLMTSHGFNFVRLRTFVDPRASDGYDKTNGNCDIAHTVAFGKQIKDAGMGLLVDFHLSDNWADPGKQCVPVAWQSLTTIEELAQAVYDYVSDSITQLIAGGSRPDMVQIGNETTPGMLIHRCDSGGQPTGTNPITGSTQNWDNLGALLAAGVRGVKDVDPTILVAFHIDRGGDKASDSPGSALQSSINWITHALEYTAFDAFGESSYQRYQGDPNSEANTEAGWTSTFNGLASEFPELQFFSAEYGPMQREINDVVFNLPNEQGLGTFNWEPTIQGDWNTGHDLFRRSGNDYTAQPDVALYDQMQSDYASRL